MAHITIGVTATRADYVATASQTVFSIPFEFFDEDDLEIYQNGTLLTKTTHYTVTPVTTSEGGFDGGTITLVTGATLNDAIAVVLNMPYDRDSDFPTTGPFNITTLNTQLDKNVVRLKQINENLGRAIIGPSSEDFDGTLPLAAARASRILGFDSSGDLTTVATDSLSVAALAAFMDHQTEYFSGDGAEVTFTLTSDPVVIDNTAVYIDGIRQKPGAGRDYTLSGFDIVFSTAPPTGTDNIQISYGQAASSFGTFADGTAAVPAIRFTDDTDTGIYRVGSNTIGFAGNGAAIASMSPNGLGGPSGSALSPGFQFLSDTDTGMYLSGTNEISFSAGNNASFTVANAQALIGNSGSAATPGLAFSSDPDTGIYRVGANIFGIAVAGLSAVQVSTSGIFNDIDGSAASPSWSFIGDTDTGMYRYGADSLGFAVGGDEGLRVYTDGAAAVNFLQVAATATGNGVRLEAAGGDTNINIILTPKASGNLVLDGLTWPNADGTASQALVTNGSGTLSFASAAGDVTGPASSTDNAIARFDLATGKLLQNSVGILTDAGVFTGVTDMTVAGPVTMTGARAGSPGSGMTIDYGSSTGRFDVQTGASGYAWQLNGSNLGSLNSSGLMSVTRVNVAAASASTPSLSFTGDTDTGFYGHAANTIGVAVGGSQVGQWDASGLHLASGTAGAPSYAFLSDALSGMYLTGVSDLGFAVAGTRYIALVSSSARGLDGSAAAPFWTFANDADTGMFSNAANQIGFAAGGTSRFVIASDTDGSVALVKGGLRFDSARTGSPTAGMTIDFGGSSHGRFDIQSGSGGYQFQFNGSTGFELTNTGFALFSNGSAAAPSGAFITDTDTGFYRIGANNMGIAAGGTKMVDISDSRVEIDNVRHTKTFTAAEAISQGELCYMNSSGQMALADADAETTADNLLGIALEAISISTTGSFLLYGEYDETDIVTTAGAVQYVSTTAGGITETAPTATGDIVRSIGYALSTTVLFFDPDRSYVEIV